MTEPMAFTPLGDEPENTEPMFDAPMRAPVTLNFTGELAGLRVTVRPAPQEQLRAAARLAELSDGPEITEADAAILLNLLDTFARHLIGWNLRDPQTREPIPPTPAGVASLDDSFTFKIVMGWLSTVELPDQPAAPDALSIPQEVIGENKREGAA